MPKPHTNLDNQHAHFDHVENPEERVSGALLKDHFQQAVLANIRGVADPKESDRIEWDDEEGGLEDVDMWPVGLGKRRWSGCSMSV